MKIDGSSQPLFTLSDGMLYDARKRPWSECCANPVRAIYSQLFQAIETTEHMRACLRHGAYCYGSGEIMFYTSDGACLCFQCARDEYRNISQSIRNACNDGWRVIGLWDSAQSDEPQYCEHCNKFVSAYEDEQEYLTRIAEGDES